MPLFWTKMPSQGRRAFLFYSAGICLGNILTLYADIVSCVHPSPNATNQVE